MNILVLESSTSSAKALLYNSKSKKIVEKSKTYSKKINNNGRQDVDEVFSLTAKLGRDVSKGKKIDCIALSSTWHNLVICDENMEPILKSYTWENVEPQEQTKDYDSMPGFHNDYYERTGCRVHALYPFFKVKMLSDQGIQFDNKRICCQGSYMFYRLTDSFKSNNSMLSGSGFLNIKRKKLDETLMSRVGVRADQFPEPVEYYETMPLTSKGAELLGLEEGIPVITAFPDGALNQVGSGALNTNNMTFSVGTSGAIRLATAEPVLPKNKATWCYLSPVSWLSGAATSGACNCVDWVKDQLFDSDVKYEDIEARFKNEKLPFFMPFLYGERAPGWRDDASSSFKGVKPYHTRFSMYESVLEGVIFNLYHCYEVLVRVNGEPKEIFISGGILNSKYWLQMCSDIFGKPMKISDVKHASIQGGIVLAQSVLGEIESIESYVPNVVEVIEPNLNRHNKYMDRFRQYLSYYREENPTDW